MSLARSIRPLDLVVRASAARVQPFDFAPNPAGQRTFAAGLGGEKLFTLDQKLAVRPVVTQEPIGIRAAQFDGSIGDGFQKSPVVADGQRGQRWIGDNLLQPENALDIQMIGRLIHQQQVRPAGQGEDDRPGIRHPPDSSIAAMEGSAKPARSNACWARRCRSWSSRCASITPATHSRQERLAARTSSWATWLMRSCRRAINSPSSGVSKPAKMCEQRRFSRTVGPDKPERARLRSIPA